MGAELVVALICGVHREEEDVHDARKYAAVTAGGAQKMRSVRYGDLVAWARRLAEKMLIRHKTNRTKNMSQEMRERMREMYLKELQTRWCGRLINVMDYVPQRGQHHTLQLHSG